VVDGCKRNQPNDKQIRHDKQQQQQVVVVVVVVVTVVLVAIVVVFVALWCCFIKPLAPTQVCSISRSYFSIFGSSKVHFPCTINKNKTSLRLMFHYTITKEKKQKNSFLRRERFLKSPSPGTR
jgi:hypothetical protein